MGQIAEHHQQIEANKALQEKNKSLQQQIDALKAALIEKPERRQSIFDKIDALQTKMDDTPLPFNDIPIIDEKILISTLETKLDVISDKNTQKIPAFTPSELSKSDNLSQSAEQRVFRTLSESNTLNEFMTKYQELILCDDKESTDSSDPDDSSYDDDETEDHNVDSLSVSKFVYGDVQSESSVLRAVTMKRQIMKNQWGGSMSSMYINHPLPDEDEDDDESDDDMVVCKVQLGQNNVPRHSQLIRKRQSEKWNVGELKIVREEMQNQLAHLVSSHVRSQSNQMYRFSIDDPKWFAIIKKLNKEISQWSPSLKSVEFIE